MSEWKKVKIGDIFSIEKGSLQSSKCTPGEYDFITAATDWKTHNSFDHECEAIVYAVAASGSLGRAHYVNGKFIASDLCFILTEKDKKQYPINFLFYQIVFEMLRDEIVSKTKTGTSKESISRGNFSNYEIPYFPIEFQLANYQKLVNAKNTIKSLLEESEVQKNYIKQLLLNILQQAIEGKLTVDWRKKNPVQKGNPDYDAEALFEQIQKEKISYTAELHLKNMNFPKINDAEVSFDSKNNWVYARGDDCFNIRSASRIHQSDWKTSGIPFLRGRELVQLSKYGKVINPETYISEEFYNELKQKSGIPSKNDLLVSAVGTLGKVYIVQETDKFYYKDAYILCFENYHKLNAKFFSLVISSPYYQKEIYKESKGTTVAQFTIGRAKFIPFPLPPLKEQEEIVNKVETLLAKVTTLEKQIQDRKSLSDKLIFGIIKENLEEK